MDIVPNQAISPYVMLKGRKRIEVPTTKTVAPQVPAIPKLGEYNEAFVMEFQKTAQVFGCTEEQICWMLNDLTCKH